LGKETRLTCINLYITIGCEIFTGEKEVLETGFKISNYTGLLIDSLYTNVRRNIFSIAKGKERMIDLHLWLTIWLVIGA
jgi:hypothetical protein